MTYVVWNEDKNRRVAGYTRQSHGGAQKIADTFMKRYGGNYRVVTLKQAKEREKEFTIYRNPSLTLHIPPRLAGKIKIRTEGRGIRVRRTKVRANPANVQYRPRLSDDGYNYRAHKYNLDAKDWVTWGGQGPSFVRSERDRCLRYCNQINRANGYPLAR